MVPSRDLPAHGGAGLSGAWVGPFRVRWRRAARRPFRPAGVPPRQLVEPGRLAGAGRCQFGRVHRLPERQDPGNPSALRKLHPDFGPPPYGIPYVAVGSSQPLVQIGSFLYADESDVGAPGQPPGYPIPDEARTLSNYIEGGVPGGGSGGDRHMLIVDRDRWLLFETFATAWNEGTGHWDASSGAVFDLSSNARRPEGWTSADAAGLAILPGLVRYDEVYGTSEIRHALRFTSRAVNGYVWPASHEAGNTTGALPLGARLRLKASVDISGFSPPLRKIFTAMKKYGLILADNGSDIFITGTMDARWNNSVLNPAFAQLDGDDFEVIQLGWKPAARTANLSDFTGDLKSDILWRQARRATCGCGRWTERRGRRRRTCGRCLTRTGRFGARVIRTATARRTSCGATRSRARSTSGR